MELSLLNTTRFRLQRAYIGGEENILVYDRFSKLLIIQKYNKGRVHFIFLFQSLDLVVHRENGAYFASEIRVKSVDIFIPRTFIR